MRHVVIELIMFPRDAESRFCAIHSDTEYDAVNRQDPMACALPRLVIEALCNIDVGYRATQT